ncbi:MAG: rhodanese-like domain-containing protein [Aquiluna sp.]|nr:rhodanese-like domain-containing protein [Aquiluna sp.]
MTQEVTIGDLAVALENQEIIVDVREGWEYESGHVPSALSMPLSSVPDKLASLPKDKTIWVICQSGGRSMTAANYLGTEGYQAVSVAGGTGAWITAGNEVSLEASK